MRQATRIALSELRKQLLNPVDSETQALRDHYWQDDNGIVDFAHEIIGIKLRSYQARILNAVQKHHRVAVKSLRGVGKTTTAAIIVLWVMSCSPDETKVITTASVWEQLTKYLWPEIRKWALRANWDKIGVTMRDSKELLKTEIHLEYGKKLAFPTSPGIAERIEGAHADTMLYVLDEAKIIPNNIFDAIEGAFNPSNTKSFIFCCSTPGAPLGRFYDIHMRRTGLHNWHIENIELHEAIEAGAIDLDHAENMRRLWGEQSALYQNYFLGNFADSSDYALMRLSWIQAAQERWNELRALGTILKGNPIYGVDPADTGMDKTAIAKLIGHVFEWTKYYNEDVMETIPRLQSLGVTKDDLIGFDGLGVGAGAYQVLRKDKYKIRNLKASAAAKDANGNPFTDSTGELRFQNMRAAMYWAFREALDPNSPAYKPIALPPDDMLVADLLAPEWSESLGVIRIEKKDKIREKLSGRSPDGGDAVVMAWWASLKSRRPMIRRV